jgi:hypothetical protein
LLSFLGKLARKTGCSKSNDSSGKGYGVGMVSSLGFYFRKDKDTAPSYCETGKKIENKLGKI